MAKQIVWTQSAKDDLENICGYIHYSDESESRIKLLLNAIEKLEKFPMNVTKYSDLPNNDYYELKHTSYKVIVKSIEDKVYILAIVHSLVTV